MNTEPDWKKKWKVTDISDPKIRTITCNVMRLLLGFKPYIYHVSKYNSVYLKFENTFLNSIRIADHIGRSKYNYTWTIRTDLGRYYQRRWDGKVDSHALFGFAAAFEEWARKRLKPTSKPADNLLTAIIQPPQVVSEVVGSATPKDLEQERIWFIERTEEECFGCGVKWGAHNYFPEDGDPRYYCGGSSQCIP